MVQEKEIHVGSGWMALFIWLFLLFVGVPALIVRAGMAHDPFAGVGAAILGVVCLIGLFGLMVVNPNEARVLVLFGTYHGSVKDSGFYWVNPFFSKKRISLRVRNFETGVKETPEVRDQASGRVVQTATHTRHPLKVNDRDGNPIEIAAVVVWRVVDTAAALFEVDNYGDYVHLQSEAALRNLASQYHYDSDDDAAHSLRGNTAQVATQLKAELQDRLSKAGVEVIEARISNLAYAPEIASAMLRRQQATAVIAARQKIVDGAVGMVEMALARLEANKIVELDGERKAQMVSNLLVVLCGDRDPQPIVNAGTLY